jgi:hypothetical protein
MLESEAKTKWCPFARVIAPIEIPGGPVLLVAGNRVSMPEHLGEVVSGEPLNPPTSRCLGGDCMQWRWTTSLAAPSGEGSAPEIDGYCGLAGKP